MSQAQVETEVKRGRGRPASFPGQETAVFPSCIPVATAQAMRDLAEARETNLNILVDRAMQRFIKDATRKQAVKSENS